MTQKGKFLLFTDFNEFKDWLDKQTVTRAIKIIQNHHTWQPDYKEFTALSDPFHWLKSMEDYQVTHEGFSQTAQNLTTFPDGSVAVGRPFNIAPAGILGANQFGLCIEHLGDFDIDDMRPSQMDTVIKLNSALCNKFKIVVDVNGVVYHHWYDLVTGQRVGSTGKITLKDGTARDAMVKSCPGVKFFGGNTVGACETIFLPLVKNQFENLNS